MSADRERSLERTNTSASDGSHTRQAATRMKLHTAASSTGRAPASIAPSPRRFLVDRSRLGSFWYKNILANRNIPILFVVVCFLVIANTNCDHASSTNGVVKQKELAESLQSDRELDQPSQQQAAVAVHIKSSTSAPAKNKLDPLHIFREIYLDGNSKLTMLLPDDFGTVQKFHPNGRYGRRSVDNFAEQRDELGKLVPDNIELDPYQSLNSVAADGEAKSLASLLRTMSRGLNGARARASPNASRAGPVSARHQQEPKLELLDSQQVSNYQLEMGKLLKCNYSGVSNLYWCESGGAIPAGAK